MTFQSIILLFFISSIIGRFRLGSFDVAIVFYLSALLLIYFIYWFLWIMWVFSLENFLFEDVFINLVMHLSPHQWWLGRCSHYIIDIIAVSHFWLSLFLRLRPCYIRVINGVPKESWHWRFNELYSLKFILWI